jgi:hypothetical protein
MTVMVSKMAHQPTPTSMNETIMDMSDSSGIKTPCTLTLGHDERRPFAKVLSECTNCSGSQGFAKRYSDNSGTYSDEVIPYQVAIVPCTCDGAEYNPYLSRVADGPKDGVRREERGFERQR